MIEVARHQLMPEDLDENLYCNLATVSNDGSPWNTPLFFVHQNDFIYWWSPKQAVHSTNILNNSKAFITVYDSTTPVGKGDGVCLYLECQAEIVKDDEVDNIIRIFNSKIGVKHFYLSRDNTTGIAPTRLYKAQILRSWLNADSTQNGFFIDIRKPV